jgi:uncharacterized protein YutE (UPF0331/DUF86 family)
LHGPSVPSIIAPAVENFAARQGSRSLAGHEQKADRLAVDDINVAAAESYLRRALEALPDLGRYILAKSFGQGVSEYKEIALRLQERELLPNRKANLLLKMAGYRNRMVHIYHEISSQEWYGICTHGLADVECVTEAFKRWIRDHPERMDETL